MAQEMELIKKIPLKANYITADHFNNFYIITDRGSLIKYTEDKPFSTFSNNRYGELKFVDATNPLKLLLFYPAYSTIVVLDKNLSELGVHQLNLRGFQDITAIGSSQDNKIWIYDKLDFRLKKLDDNGEVLLKSENLSSLDMEIDPNFILHKNNWIYMNDPEHGILVFDNYATYFKTIPIKGLTHYQVVEDKLIYYQNGLLQSFDLKTLEPAQFKMPFTETIKNLAIQKKRIFILTNEAVEVFQY